MTEDEQWVMLEEPEPTEQQKMFAEAHQKATERIKEYEARIVAVVRGHLAAEQSLNFFAHSGSKEKARPKVSRQDVRRQRKFS